MLPSDTLPGSSALCLLYRSKSACHKQAARILFLRLITKVNKYYISNYKIFVILQKYKNKRAYRTNDRHSGRRAKAAPGQFCQQARAKRVIMTNYWFTPISLDSASFAFCSLSSFSLAEIVLAKEIAFT